MAPIKRYKSQLIRGLESKLRKLRQPYQLRILRHLQRSFVPTPQTTSSALSCNTLLASKLAAAS